MKRSERLNTEWVFDPDNTKEEMIDIVLQPFDGPIGYQYAPIDHRLVGNVLWVIEEVDYRDGSADHDLVAYLFKYVNGQGWGFRRFTEQWDPPPFFNCPPDFLERTRVANEEWRKQAWEWLQTHTIEVGGPN